MSVWPMAGDGNFGLLLQGVSPGVLTASVVWLLSWVASVRAVGGEDLCVPQFLACFFSCSFLNSHLLAFSSQLPESASPLLSSLFSRK